MRYVRRIGWGGLLVSVVGGFVGLGVAVGSAVAAGDWDLAPMPWIGVGMTVTTVSLAAGGCFALLLDAVEPIGWRRLLAVPPAVVVVGFWMLTLVEGVPTTGGTEYDVPTILYSMPSVLAILVLATTALAIPAFVGRRPAAP